MEPVRLVMLGRRWYLVAYDLARHDWRTFRVDRIAAPALDRHAVPAETRADRRRGRVRPLVDPGGDDPVGDRRRGRNGRRRSPPPRRAAGGGDRSRTGRCRLAIAADGFDWPTMLVASLGADFRVVEPPEFRTHLATVGRRFAGSAIPAAPTAAEP